jgi:23S rRNA (pseudouridine1915-N3)-methyltransferase
MLPVKIEIITLGKLSKEYAPIIREYEKRISSLAHAKFLETTKIPKDAILLDPRGREMSSEEFYELLRKRSSSGEKIIFVIGPPQGFSDVSGYERISLSKMTLQHDLARLVLLEQIYRALLKMKGTRYEK